MVITESWDSVSHHPGTGGTRCTTHGVEARPGARQRGAREGTRVMLSWPPLLTGPWWSPFLRFLLPSLDISVWKRKTQCFLVLPSASI